MLIEQGIDGREIECAVLCPKAGDEPEASWPGEIVLDHQNDDQFYDFDSKYMDASASHVEVPANLPVSVLEDVRDVARRAFKAVDGAGLSRVDTFVTPDGTVDQDTLKDAITIEGDPVSYINDDSTRITEWLQNNWDKTIGN